MEKTGEMDLYMYVDGRGRMTMPRALRSFSQYGLEVIPAPTGQSAPPFLLPQSLLPSTQALWSSSQVCREAVGHLAYQLFHWY